MAKTKETTVDTSIVSAESLKQFDAVKEVAIEKANQLLSIKVTDETSVTVARQVLNETNGMLTLVEDRRKAIKEPYKVACEQIDALGKEIKKPLEEAIVYGKNEIKAYEVEKEKKAKEELAAIQKANEEKDKERKEAEEKLAKANAWKAKTEEWFDGNYKQLNDPVTLAGFGKQFSDFIEASLPKLPAILVESVKALKENSLALINNKIELLSQKENLTEEQKKLAEDKLKLAEEKKKLADREQEIASREAAEAKRIEDEKASKIAEEEAIKAELEQKNQKPNNIRKIWKFELVDKSKLIEDWITVDDTAVKEYLKANKETLKDGSIVNGIKFYQDSTVVA